MRFNENEPQRALPPGREPAHDIRDSFQAILDALDTARAALYAGEDDRPEAGSPPPSFGHHSEPTGDGDSTGSARFPSPPPDSAPHQGRQPVGPGFENLVPARPHGLLPPVEDRPRTGSVRGAPMAAVPEPLWARGTPPGGPVQPPNAQEPPPSTSHTGRRHAEPPPAFLPPAPPAEGAPHGSHSSADAPGSAAPHRSASPADRLVDQPDEKPQRREPIAVDTPVRKRSRGHRRFTDRRHSRGTGIFVLGAASGVFLASSLLFNEHSTPAVPPASLGQPDRPWPGDPSPAPTVPSPPAGQPEQPLPGGTSLPEIPGTGVLRQGDSGHGVYELQVRLQQIPHIYDGGAVSGRFDAEVRQAVARIQQRYGVRGYESGVYGDNTRYALMLRTR